jgi:hypothetical protein
MSESTNETRRVLLFWQQRRGVLIFIQGPPLTVGEVMTAKIGPEPPLAYTVVAAYGTGPEALDMVAAYGALFRPVMELAHLNSLQEGVANVRAAGTYHVYLLKPGTPALEALARGAGVVLN